MRYLKTPILWIPAALWYAFIWSLSAQTASVSGGLSDGLLQTVLRRLCPSFSAAAAEVQAAAAAVLSFFVRKAAHMFLYFILLWLLWLGLCRLLQGVRRQMAAAAVLCALLAALDEFHQTFVPGRSGEVKDVLIDLSGAAMALLLTALLHWSAGRRCPHPGKKAALALLAGALPLAAAARMPSGYLLLRWPIRQFLQDVSALPLSAQEALLSGLSPILREVLCLAGAAGLGLCSFFSVSLIGRFDRRSLLTESVLTAAAAGLAAAPMSGLHISAIVTAEGVWLFLVGLRVLTVKSRGGSPALCSKAER